MRVTIADVAGAAGVSKTAVSFAFNNPEKLGQATLERVLQVAHDLGYTPHPAARALSLRRSGTIGILIPQRLSTVFANQFLSELFQGLGELVEEHDLSLLLVPPLDGSLEGAIRQASVDGFISLGLSPDDEALATLALIGIPTVLIDSEGSAEHPAVNVDDAGGAEAAARHLLELGARCRDARTGTVRAHARSVATARDPLSSGRGSKLPDTPATPRPPRAGAAIPGRRDVRAAPRCSSALEAWC